MNVYSLFPLVATIAYIPLIVSVISSRPWQRRRTLFVLFLVPAMLWSFCDYFWRSNIFPESTLLLGRITLLFVVISLVQLHYFASHFFDPGKGRWLPYAYTSLAISISLILLGYIPESVEFVGERLYPEYGTWMFVVVALLLVLAVRDFSVFGKMLRRSDNPVLNNQIVSLLLGLSSLIFFCLISFLPFGREYPVAHIGNLMNAFILSYAVIRHRLVDIRLVLRHGMAWLTLGLIGSISFWLLITALRAVFHFEMDLVASLLATLLSLFLAICVYKLRVRFIEVMNRVFHGSTYVYRQQLADFTRTIHNVFSLKEQGGELLALLSKAIGISQASLLFPESGGEEFCVQFAEPEHADNALCGLKMNKSHPVVKYLEREQRPLARENLAILPEFLGLWERERKDLEARQIEMFVPLISRDHLIAILVLGNKLSGKYLLEDLSIIEDITARVAVSMEKEYLREQLREREEELSVINRSSAIITSSLDIQEIYDSFIQELKKVIDISWAAIVLVEEKELCFLSLSSEMDTDWRVGETVALSGSGTEWVINHRQAVYEADLQKEEMFIPSPHYLEQGLRSIVHLPLIAKGDVIGSFIVASSQPDAYSQRNVMLLEQLASQVSMPVQNSRLYARISEKARYDELTSLLNRRSLDEALESEIGRYSRYGGIFSLAILDLDSFKVFNDTYGHLAGDRLLGQIGAIIKNTVRSSDQAFRYGGDEFAVFLPETASCSARQVIERVRQKIAERSEGDERRITASFGLACWPADGASKIDIIMAADVALYKAKRGGGNRLTCASEIKLPVNTGKSATGGSKDELKE